MYKNRWFVPVRANPTAAYRLFCFPYAGGAASIYRGWGADLPPDSEVWAVQPPGRESRLATPAALRLLELADQVAYALVPAYNKPIVFFGHSMGALLAFEVARIMRRQYDVSPLHLFLSGHRAPGLAPLREPIHHLPDDQFEAHLARMNGTPQEVLAHRELMELLLPTLRADFTACETYEYVADEPLACPVTVFGGLSDPEVPVADLAPWSEVTTGPFGVQTFPGDHFFLRPEQRSLLRAIGAALAPSHAVHG